MKIDALAGKKLSCIAVAMSLIVSPAPAIAEEGESIVSSSEASEVVSETTNEAVDEASTSEAIGVTDSEIETNNGDYQDNIFVSSSLLSVESASSALVMQSDEDIASGEYCGLTWRIESDGTLVLGDGTEQTYGAIPSTSNPQPWYSYATSITSVKVDGIVHATSNSLSLFLSGATNLLSVDLDGLDTSNATTMYGMFKGCSNLTSVPLSNLDTSNATNTSSMFSDCSSLSQLDMANFNTSNVTDMSSMFSNCSSLTILDVSGFDTSNVTSVSNMFQGCKKLSTIDVASWNTAKISNAAYLFSSCTALSDVSFANWDTSNMTNLNSMFYRCSSLKTLDLSNFNTSNVTNMSYMFLGCQSLEEIVGISSFNTSKVSYMSGMFSSCLKLASIDVSNFDTSNVTGMSFMFSDCRVLESIDVSSFNTSKVTSMSGLFSNCYNLKAVNVSNFDTSNVTTMSSMFNNCYNLEAIDVSRFNTTKVTNMSSMFSSCQKLAAINVRSFNTSNVKNMSSMFSNCLALTSIDIINFDMSLSSSTYNSSIKSFGIKSMFANCAALSSVSLGKNNVLYASGDVNGAEVTCSVELPDAPMNDDYQGKWWFEGGTGYTAAELMSSYDGSTMSTTYVWMPAAYTITYVAPDGLLFGNGEQIVSMSVIKNDSFEVETGNELLEDNAYYVTSWNTQADGSGVTYENGVTYIPTSDVTLYAVIEMGGVATGKTDIHNIDSDGDGYGDNISFSVPTSIYGYVNSDGSIFVNDSDFYIENCSSEDIVINGITSDGWDSRVSIVDDASSSAVENAMSITMEPVTSEVSSLTPIKSGSETSLYDKYDNPSWKVGSGSFTSPTKLYIDVEMNVANASDGLFSYEPMKIGSMHWYCQIAKYYKAIK